MVTCAAAVTLMCGGCADNYGAYPAGPVYRGNYYAYDAYPHGYGGYPAYPYYGAPFGGVVVSRGGYYRDGRGDHERRDYRARGASRNAETRRSTTTTTRARTSAQRQTVPQ